MVNYQCNAACRHCLYSCSPTRRAGYLSEESAEEICRLLLKGGCRSVHIGGGEPFLDFEGLLMTVRKLNQAGISLEYIETNAFFVEGSSNRAREYLKRLMAEGVDTLCISVDPYHAEYVPYGAPVALAELCGRIGMGFFLWKREYLSMLSPLSPDKTHSRMEMEKAISPDYVVRTARFYGIGYGGRAINIEGEFAAAGATLYLAEELALEKSPCANLLSTGHFHVDMDRFFIPPRCTGIRIPLSEAAFGIPDGKYPVFEALYHGGVSALFELALQHGFSPVQAGYLSKCNLCFFIRKLLSEKGFAELDSDHYVEALKHYQDTKRQSR